MSVLACLSVCNSLRYVCLQEDVAWEWEQVFTEVSSELLAEWERQETVEQ